jgi:hypothetical protein
LGTLHYTLYDSEGDSRPKNIMSNVKSNLNAPFAVVDFGGQTCSYALGTGVAKLTNTTGTFYGLGSVALFAGLSEELRSRTFKSRGAFSKMVGEKIPVPILTSILHHPDYLYVTGDVEVDCSLAVEKALRGVMSDFWAQFWSVTNGFIRLILCAGGGSSLFRNALCDTLEEANVFADAEDYVILPADADVMWKTNPLGHISTVVHFRKSRLAEKWASYDY